MGIQLACLKRRSPSAAPRMGARRLRVELVPPAAAQSVLNQRLLLRLRALTVVLAAGQGAGNFLHGERDILVMLAEGME